MILTRHDLCESWFPHMASTKARHSFHHCTCSYSSSDIYIAAYIYVCVCVHRLSADRYYSLSALSCKQMVICKSTPTSCTWLCWLINWFTYLYGYFKNAVVICTRKHFVAATCNLSVHGLQRITCSIGKSVNPPQPAAHDWLMRLINWFTYLYGYFKNAVV